MNVLILELNHHGHRFRYVRHLIDALQGLPVCINVVLHTSARGSDEWKEFLEPVDSRFITSWSDTQRFSADAVIDIIHSHAPDHVYIPYADDWLWQLAKKCSSIRALRNTEVEGLCLFTAFAYPERGLFNTINSLLKFSVGVFFSGIRPLHVLDIHAYHLLKRLKPLYCGEWIPDHTEVKNRYGREEARSMLGLSQDDFLIVLPGVIDQRKGADQIVNAFSRAEHRIGPSVKLILAGKHHEQIKRLIEETCSELTANNKLISLDRFLNEQEFQAAVESADVIAAPYCQHYGSSSILLLAGLLGIPVLGANDGWIGRMLSSEQLGIPVDCTDVDALADALISIQRKCSGEKRFGFGANEARQYAKKNFNLVWTKRLHYRIEVQANRSGRPQTPLGASARREDLERKESVD